MADNGINYSSIDGLVFTISGTPVMTITTGGTVNMTGQLSAATFVGNASGMTGIATVSISSTTLSNNILNVVMNNSGLTATTINAVTGGTYSNGTITTTGSGTLANITGLIASAVTSTTLTNNIITATQAQGTATATTINAVTGGTYSNGTITHTGSGTIANITGLIASAVTSTTLTNNILTATQAQGIATATTINAATGGTFAGGTITLLGSGTLTTIAGIPQAVTQLTSAATITNNILSVAYSGQAATATTINAATGGTYNAFTGIITQTGSGTLSTITGLSYLTADTLTNNIFSSTRNGSTATATTINAATGGTFSNGILTLAGSGTLSNISGFAASASTIYTSDDTVAGNRTVNLSSFTLTFSSATQPNNLVMTGGSVGIGLVAGSVTNKLHVSAATNPIRIQGLTANTNDTSLVGVDASGVFHSYPISSLPGTGATFAGGATTQVQYNNNNAFSGSPNVTISGGNLQLILSSTTLDTNIVSVGPDGVLHATAMSAITTSNSGGLVAMAISSMRY